MKRQTTERATFGTTRKKNALSGEEAWLFIELAPVLSVPRI